VAVSVTAMLWAVLAIVALGWPSRALGLLDGLPLNGRAEALALGLIVPALLWFAPHVLQRGLVRVAIVGLLTMKVAGLLLTPQGLCARFSTAAPFVGETHTIPIDEPQGWLRSWDVRANWRDTTPTCTAIVDRAYADSRSFPAWFVNLVDSIRPGQRDLSLELNGSMHVTEAGVFSMAVADDMRVNGDIGGRAIEYGDHSIVSSLPQGDHQINLTATLTGDNWTLQPRWNDRDAWDAAVFTVAQPGAIDRIAPVIGITTTLLAGAIVVAWLLFALAPWFTEPALLAWSVAASIAMALAATIPGVDRVAALLLAGAIAIPIATRHRNLRAAFLLIGVPWLAFFALRAVPDIGAYTAYSHDDWLAYQVAGYRIFMGGYWLEGGNLVFDYQPLYRWISGALHLVFGDSSAGEIFVDAASLLTGALLAFWIAKATAGFRWGVAAGAGVLISYSLGTTWYFVGRGLSETVGAGFGFAAAFLLLRGRLGRTRSIVAAGVLAGLMFYTRLNYLIAAAMLVAFLLPLRVTAQRLVAAMTRRTTLLASITYLAVLATCVMLFMTRTWWYTGRFSALYGTSLKNNDIGLRFTTIADLEVWQKIRHSLASLILMNEPPHFDARAVLVIVGTLIVVLAAIQVPPFRRLPASLVIVALGTCASAFIVHTHNYPGRMSIPLVPFACAAAVIGAASLRKLA
jgi:hypothetical protein